MANNYTQFSAELDLGSFENVKIALATLAEHVAADMEANSCTDNGWINVNASAEHESTRPTKLWIHSGDESGDVEATLDFVATIGKALKLKGLWGFSWADTCSKLRIDEFGGGAAIVNLANGRVEFINTYQWLDKKLRPRKAA